MWRTLTDAPLVPGDYDYDLLRECLEAGGYSGGISVECKWEDFKAEAPIALRTLRQAWS